MRRTTPRGSRRCRAAASGSSPGRPGRPDTLPEPATWRGTFPARDGRHTGSRRARVTGCSTSSRGLPHAKGRAVLVPVQFAGGLTSNASSSTNEMKHPAEGSQVWTRVRDSWWLVGLLEDLELQPQPCSDPSGRWSRWRRTSIRRGHGVSPWVYRGLSPRGGCGGCPVAVASGHEAAG
jgi:hypothetical protein